MVQGEGVDGTPSPPLGFLYVAVFGGGEWYLEKRGSRKILAGSRNLGSVFDKSRSIVSAWFVFTFYESRNFYQRVSGSDFLTRMSASRRVSDFTIRHPYYFEANLPSVESLSSSLQDEVYFVGGGAAGGL